MAEHELMLTGIDLLGRVDGGARVMVGVGKGFVPYGSDGKATDGSGLVFDDALNWQLVETMARDSRADIDMVFISRPLRARLLAFAAKKKRPQKYVDLVTKLFMQPEDAEPHNDHFHVRIKCPKGQEEICR